MNESIEELLASGAVVPDRPGSKRLVPAAPSVVVPREPTNEMWAAGERAFDRDPDLHHETVVANIWFAMLAAAPTPSSLAGGEVSRAVDHLTKRLNKPGAFHLSDQTSIRAILDALSPEALQRRRHGGRDVALSEVRRGVVGGAITPSDKEGRK